MTETDPPCPTNDDLLHEAERELASGRRPEAIRALERRIERDPLDEETALLAAKLHLDERDFPRAAELALRALRIRPFHPAALNLLGVACLDGGHPAVAEKLLRRATRIAPGHRSARQNLKIARSEARRTRGREAAAPARADLDLDAIRERLSQQGCRLSVCTVAHDPEDVEFGLPRVDARVELHETRVVDATPGGIPDSETAPHRTIHRVPHSPDRSVAWNVALHGATGDWILALEPGERLEGQSRASLRRAMSDAKALAHAVTVRTPDGSERREIRLFRNAPGIRFGGRGLPGPHESLAQLAEEWKTDLGRRVRIVVESERDSRFWTGGLPPGVRSDNAIELALAALEAGAPQQALELLAARTPTACDRWGLEAEQLATIEGRCWMRLQRFDELSQRMQQYHRRARPTPNTRFLAGLALRATGDAERAVHELQESATTEHEAGFVPALPERTGTGRDNLLGAALMDLGRVDEAVSTFEAALRRQPDALEPRLGLIGLGMARGEVRASLAQLDELAVEHGHNQMIWIFGAALLGRLPELAPVAGEWLDEACRRFPNDLELRQARGEARLLNGDGEAALLSLDASDTAGPDRLAARVAAALSTGAGIPAVPQSVREQVEQGVLRWMQAWMERSALESLDRALVEVARASAELPGLAERTASWLQTIGQSEAAQLVRSRVAGSS